ncbi:MAG: hypothetical protein IJ222_03380 [Bacteroidales bacterium]|nr:hypothetical protein [Bacteroidales bacterium]
MSHLLRKLRALNSYLRRFTVPGRDDVKVSYVTAYADATSRLNNETGVQVLIARPEMHSQSPDGEAAAYAQIESAVFILMKDFGSARTDALELEAYDDMEDIADAVLAEIYGRAGSCSQLAGIRCTGFEIVPVTSTFGSWFGYSIVITFE